MGQAGQDLVTIGGTIAAAVADLILVLVMSFLWLTTSDRLKSFLVDLFPPRAQALVIEVIQDTGYRMGGDLLARSRSTWSVVGVATGIACAVLRLPSPSCWASSPASAAAVPMIGAILGVVPAALLGLTVSPEYPVLVLVVLGVFEMVDANTVVPVVMNRALALPHWQWCWPWWWDGCSPV